MMMLTTQGRVQPRGSRPIAWRVAGEPRAGRRRSRGGAPQAAGWRRAGHDTPSGDRYTRVRTPTDRIVRDAPPYYPTPSKPARMPCSGHDNNSTIPQRSRGVPFDRQPPRCAARADADAAREPPCRLRRARRAAGATPRSHPRVRVCAAGGDRCRRAEPPAHLKARARTADTRRSRRSVRRQLSLSPEMSPSDEPQQQPQQQVGPLRDGAARSARAPRRRTRTP